MTHGGGMEGTAEGNVPSKAKRRAPSKGRGENNK